MINTQAILSSKIFSLDTETTGLLYDDSLLGISIGWKEGEGYKAIWLPIDEIASQRGQIQAVLSNPELTMVGHNLVFDLRILRKFGFEINNQYFDTYIAARMVSPQKGSKCGLKDLGKSVLNEECMSYKELLKKYKVKTIDQVPKEEVEKYTIKDAILPLKLKELFDKWLDTTGQRKYFEEIEMPFIDVNVEMQTNGVKLDIPLILETRLKAEHEYQRLKKELMDEIGNINLNSPKQLTKLLYDDMGLPKQYRERKKKDGTKVKTSTADDEALDYLFELYPDHGFLKKFSAYRTQNKMLSTYILPYLEYKSQDNYLRTSYNQVGTNTFRLSSSNPVNLQNVPKGENDPLGIRNFFVCEEDEEIISIDFQQFEYRLLASLCKDSEMVDAFKNGIDFHSLTAATTFGENFTDDERKKAKGINFARSYGAGIVKMSTLTGLTVEETKEAETKYKNRFKEYYTWRGQVINSADIFKYVQTLNGRKIPVEKGYLALDYTVQALAGEIMKMVQVKLQNLLKNTSFRQRIQIHDELFATVKKSEIDKLLPIIQKTFETCINLVVPLLADVKIGNRWGQLKKREVNLVA